MEIYYIPNIFANKNFLSHILGAKVKLHESNPRGIGRVPKETHVAQGLLKAFAMSGQNALMACAF